MTDIVLTPITSGYNLTKINANFTKVQNVINSEVIHSTGGNNVMAQDLDMNGHVLLNLYTNPADPNSMITVAGGDDRYYNVSGDTLAGTMNAANNQIINLPTPISSTSPVRKVEIDAAKAQSVRGPDGETLLPLGTAASRANKVMGFDGIGNPIGVVPISGSATELALDLANATDSTKGANLIGNRGSTVGATLDLTARKPRKVFSKLFAAAAAISHLRVVVIGDSLGGAKMLQLSASLDRRMGGVNMAGVNSAGNGAGEGSATGGYDLSLQTSSLVTNETLQYQYWPTGLVTRFNDGATGLWSRNASSPTFTDIKVYYVKEPGAGVVTVTVGSTVVATADANATGTSLGILSYTQAAATASVTISVAGGPVRVLLVHTRNTTTSGLDEYQTMNRGGLLLADATSTAQGRAIWQGVLTDIVPDLITFEMDDDFGDGASADTSLAQYLTIIEAAAPYADKLFIGSTPRLASDALKMRSGNYLKTMCSQKNASYLFFDSYHLLGSYADMNAIFGTDDGIHPVAAAQAFAAEVLWEHLGLNGFNLGYTSRAVNDRGTASRLSRGTTIGDRPGREISITADAASGSDFAINLTRSLATVRADGTILHRVSGQVGVISNVLPMTTDFGTAGDVRKRNVVTSSGIEVTQLVKTDNPSGMQHMRMGLIFNSFTRAQLLAISAATIPGALAFCPDCTGGAQWVYARGLTSGDWVTVKDQTLI